MKLRLFILILLFSACITNRSQQEFSIEEKVTNDTIYEGRYKRIAKDSLIIREKDTATINELRIYQFDNNTDVSHTYWGYFKKDIDPEVPDYKHIIPIREYYFRNNKLISETFHFPKKDSMIYGRDTEQCLELEINYDEKGNIIQRSCNGIASNEDINTGFGVGTCYIYKNNKLIKELYFHNAKRGDDYILHKIYDGKGGYKEIYTNNYMLYENDSVVLSPKEIKRRIKTKK